MLITRSFDDVALDLDVPDGWDVVNRAVPALVVPREIFATSNRTIPVIRRSSEQPRPGVQGLDREAVLLWCYYQAPHDPDPSYLDPSPRWASYRPGLLSLTSSERRHDQDAREWSPHDFIWRRCGFCVGPLAVSFWIWEGADAAEATIAALDAALQSVTLRGDGASSYTPVP